MIGKQYSTNEFARVYHGRWGVEELYKISKRLIEIGDLHSKTERGVKQELYAHALLINIARIFESAANNRLPPSTPTHDGRKDKIELKENYWQDFCGKIHALKIILKIV